MELSSVPKNKGKINHDAVYEGCKFANLNQSFSVSLGKDVNCFD
jgi:hypothetical protein